MQTLISLLYALPTKLYVGGVRLPPITWPSIYSGCCPHQFYSVQHLPSLYTIIEVSRSLRLTIKTLRWNASFEKLQFGCFLVGCGSATQYFNKTRFFNAGIISIVIQPIHYSLYYNLHLQKLTAYNKRPALICELRKSAFWLLFRGARLRVFEPQFFRMFFATHQ
jgi:hypothetical protein